MVAAQLQCVAEGAFEYPCVEPAAGEVHVGMSALGGEPAVWFVPGGG